ncbi:heat shock protein Hsp15 [Ferrimonas balearica DSM 9799]|uniref:Heat shock protein 15 n=1 Tax=Ferrimonas balearica (strain DSM 9799 / CCM 4581 / KCTC 23876 / PAT) TaxID=550540 RepID=E1SL32_FERBD|nr:ribosome-associated heat shock protein Hsp15 [Ferrimonas balearica]ADN74426.1 heat shock protein Hsp15 [Ferrimonas balearica DSM 9799]MBW3141153.1 ribosome-associated heat shock protein Hsp15 [Ferrimonas balearica]MBW3166008.1 ribosome-associated heat shock protein Hsp15 [Ferrimonas balearica]MBY6096195.1 ribosome-associated heat shock protein Hsp15 [Ferrimonas balearica]MBY6108186.1 ribosome-associated heat shock protein Hsp15 [Ferrimonas balearica]
MSKPSPKEIASAVRLDKWLWAARFYKTRALAQEMISGGKVQVNGQRCKPGRKIEVGATLTLWQGNDEKELVIVGLSEKRLSAPLAQALYEETEASITRRTERAEQRRLMADADPRASRPDKKQRRALLRFKNQDE